MEPNSKIIIVPWDFTLVAEYALQHAVKFATTIEAKIVLLHIVKKDEDIPEIKDQLLSVAKESAKSFKIETEAIVMVGTIFSTITQMAMELKAEMVVMGTHGIKGMQKYLGSWAIKVISNTYIPFVVVQDSPRENIFNEILFPISFRKEAKEMLTWIVHFSKFFDVKVRMFAARYSDRKLKKSVSSNILFAKNIFEKKRIAFELEWAASKREFPKQVVDFGKKIDADMIMLMITRDLTLADYIIGTTEQYIIANSDKLPVMCINPRPITNVSGFSAGGG